MQLESVIAENMKEPLKCSEKGLQWRVSSYLCRQTWIRTIEGAHSSSLLHELGQHCLTTVLGTKHICNNFRITLTNLKLNIHIVVFNILGSVAFKKKKESSFYLFTQSPKMYWVLSVPKNLM